MAILTRRLSELFEEFLRSFVDRSGEYKYQGRIAQLAATGAKSVVVDYEDLIQYNTDLAERVMQEPDESLREFRASAFEVLSTENSAYANAVRQTLGVRIRGIADRVALRKVDTSHLDKLIAFAGMIVRTSELRPLLMEAVFVCPSGHTTQVHQEGPSIKRPPRCESCEEVRNLELDQKRSRFIDSQILRIQELPEELPPGQLPRFFDIDAEGEVVNTARPGDRVVMTGIVRAEIDITPGQPRSRSFRSKIECNYIEVLGKDPTEVQITREDESTIRSIAATPEAYQKLVRSMAPAILGHEPVKEAILLLLVGGPRTFLPDGTKLRGDINVLLVGDPGVAKSEMLKFCAQVAPRGMFTSGRGSTAAGLSAAVLREKNTFMLEAGVVVLADQGVACIDEFDKMKPEDRSALHEQMEQNSYHPSTEILLSDGHKVPIGSLVDGILCSSASKVVSGKNCEIAIPDGKLEVYSADLSSAKIARVPIDRVSRHEAPDHFIKVTFSNGREIVVTPEHPVFVFRDGGLATVEAEDLETGEYVPAPDLIPNSSSPVPVTLADGRKHISQPQTLSLGLARILGYLVTEGHSYVGSTFEVGFTNLSTRLLTDMRRLMLDEFGIEPMMRTLPNGGSAGLRYISKTLYGSLLSNFPEIMRKARQKRAPYKVLGSSVSHINQFLASAFLGDGSVETDAICYRTASPGLAEDYQDLLLKLGVASRITRDVSNDSFKVYVMADSLDRFASSVVDPDDPRIGEIMRLVARSTRGRDPQRDVIPPGAIQQYITVLKELGIAYDGRFWRDAKEGKRGVNKRVLLNTLAIAEERYSQIVRFLVEGGRSLKEIRSVLHWSQERLASAAGMSRSTISYAEAGGYSTTKRSEITEEIQGKLRTRFERFDGIVELKRLMRFRFLKVRRTERVQNAGSLGTEWVYDVTVEPQHNFVSAGTILHNTVTIAKGGIFATLNARTSILAATNPILGKYNPYQNLIDNISLPIPLLTRFDLIFVLRDTPGPAQDEQLARHILDVHRKRTYVESPPIQFELLKKYIAYAKNISPSLSLEAEERLKQYYLQLRKSATEGQIAATARTLESLIRLASARARLLLREQVIEDDALAAIALMNKMVEDVLTDTETKTKGDFGILLGQPKGERGKLSSTMDTLRSLEGTDKKPVEAKILKQELLRTGAFANEDEVNKMIQRMIKEGIIFEIKPGFYRRVQA